MTTHTVSAADVRFWLKADESQSQNDVRSYPGFGHSRSPTIALVYTHVRITDALVRRLAANQAKQVMRDD